MDEEGGGEENGRNDRKIGKEKHEVPRSLPPPVCGATIKRKKEESDDQF